jgi:hypothetical protein
VLRIRPAARAIFDTGGTRDTACKILSIVGTVATQRAKKALCASGWLKVLPKSPGPDAHTYQLQQPRGTSDEKFAEIFAPTFISSVNSASYNALPLSPSLSAEDEEEGALVYSTCGTGEDTWRWRSGLGKSARLVYSALEERSWPLVRALALARGMCPDTVERALKRLATHGLVLRDEG